jgi:hypothetical protein
MLKQQTSHLIQINQQVKTPDFLFGKSNCFIFKYIMENRKHNYENQNPSPDRSGNPFVPGFGTKDWNG